MSVVPKGCVVVGTGGRFESAIILGPGQNQLAIWGETRSLYHRGAITIVQGSPSSFGCEVPKRMRPAERWLGKRQHGEEKHWQWLLGFDQGRLTLWPFWPGDEAHELPIARALLQDGFGHLAVGNILCASGQFDATASVNFGRQLMAVFTALPSSQEEAASIGSHPSRDESSRVLANRLLDGVLNFATDQRLLPADVAMMTLPESVRRWIPKSPERATRVLFGARAALESPAMKRVCSTLQVAAVEGRRQRA